MPEKEPPLGKTDVVKYNPEQEIVQYCEEFKKGHKTGLNKWLSEASEDDYQTYRKTIRSKLDWDIKAVDKKRKDLHGGGKSETRATCIEWDMPEPWGETVNGSQLLTDIFNFIQRHVILKKELNETVTVWSVMTWLHESLDVAPFLNITSPTKECGKSTLLDVLGELTKRPLPNAGPITGAALFRTIAIHSPTMLLDEVDRYLKDNPDLIGTINGSQRKSQAYVIRCVGDQHEPQKFCTWSPKVLTGISDIPDTVLSRSIAIRMERRPKSGPRFVQFRSRDKQAVLDLQRKIIRWVDDNRMAIIARLDKVKFPEGLDDRAADSWECLLAIADIAGGDWPSRLYSACSVATKEKDETGIREILLADIRTVFEREKNPKNLSTSLLIEKLTEIDDRPWSEFSRGKPITPVKLARLLKPFGISSGTIRTATGTPKGYKRKSFTSAWGAYLPATSPQPAENLGELDFSKRHTEENVSDKNQPKTASSLDCGSVAAEIPPYRG